MKKIMNLKTTLSLGVCLLVSTNCNVIANVIDSSTKAFALIPVKANIMQCDNINTMALLAHKKTPNQNLLCADVALALDCTSNPLNTEGQIVTDTERKDIQNAVTHIKSQSEVSTCTNVRNFSIEQNTTPSGLIVSKAVKCNSKECYSNGAKKKTSIVDKITKLLKEQMYARSGSIYLSIDYEADGSITKLTYTNSKNAKVGETEYVNKNNKDQTIKNTLYDNDGKKATVVVEKYDFYGKALENTYSIEYLDANNVLKKATFETYTNIFGGQTFVTIYDGKKIVDDRNAAGNTKRSTVLNVQTGHKISETTFTENPEIWTFNNVRNRRIENYVGGNSTYDVTFDPARKIEQVKISTELTNKGFYVWTTKYYVGANLTDANLEAILIKLKNIYLI